MAKKRKDKLVAVKLTSDELMTLDNLVDYYDTDRSKIIRLGLRALDKQTRFLRKATEDIDLTIDSRRRAIMMTATFNDNPPFRTKEEEEEYDKAMEKELEIRHKLNGGEKNDE